MIRSLLICCILACCFTACKTVNIQNESQNKTEQQIVLGSVGLDDQMLLEKGFTNVALPNYTEPLKLGVSIVPFNKKSFQAFSEAKKIQGSELDLSFDKDVKNNSSFVHLYIADKVALIAALNSEENKGIKDYLSIQSEAVVNTSMSLVLSEAQLKSIAAAESCYLEQQTSKTYVLQLYNKGEKSEAIFFNDAVVFAYKTQTACWKENTKRQLNIVDLVDSNQACPRETSKKASRAKKEINYFKL